MQRPALVTLYSVYYTRAKLSAGQVKNIKMLNNVYCQPICIIFGTCTL